MEQFPTTEPTPSNEIIINNNLLEQSNQNTPYIEQNSQQENGFFDPSLATKPAEQWSDIEIKTQQEYARSKMEQDGGEIAKIRAETARQVSEIKTEAERRVLDIAGETYIKITQEIGLPEQEAIEMIGKDKMIKIIGEEKVNQIKDNFDREVMVAAVDILESAFKEVGAAIDRSIPNLEAKIQ